MDCNKTINFLLELKRLCDSRDECVANAENKEDCPMFGVCKLTHSKICAKDAKKAIETVQKWSDKHKKTYAEDFFNKFPNFPNIDGTPIVCRREVYGGSKCKLRFDNCVKCAKCWNEEMEV